MWKWLHPYAKSETQYHLCGKLAPFFAILTILLLGTVCACAGGNLVDGDLCINGNCRRDWFGMAD